VGSHAWKVNSGTYTLLAGTSSRDPNALTASVSLSAH
jgi:beta-glucosidase